MYCWVSFMCLKLVENVYTSLSRSNCLGLKMHSCLFLASYDTETLLKFLIGCVDCKYTAKWKINSSKHLSDLQNEATAREGQFCFSCLWIHFWMARIVYKKGQFKNPEHLMGSPNFSWNGQSTRNTQHIVLSLPSLLKPSPISMGLAFWSEVLL